LHLLVELVVLAEFVVVLIYDLLEDVLLFVGVVVPEVLIVRLLHYQVLCIVVELLLFVLVLLSGLLL